MCSPCHDHQNSGLGRSASDDTHETVSAENGIGPAKEPVRRAGLVSADVYRDIDLRAEKPVLGYHKTGFRFP